MKNFINIKKNLKKITCVNLAALTLDKMLPNIFKKKS